ncbi:MAG: hypothetical protein ACR2QJ_08250 [Geminicoccaceae bacterium]
MTGRKFCPVDVMCFFVGSAGTAKNWPDRPSSSIRTKRKEAEASIPNMALKSTLHLQLILVEFLSSFRDIDKPFLMLRFNSWQLVAWSRC